MQEVNVVGKTSFIMDNVQYLHNHTKVEDNSMKKIAKTHTSSNMSNDTDQTKTIDINHLHIVLVTETWLPDINGVSLSLNNIMNALHDMGHNISLIRPKAKHTEFSHSQHNNQPDTLDNSSKNTLETPLCHELQVKGLPIPKYANLQFGLPAFKQIKKYLTQIKPDVVHIATEGPLGLAALTVAKQLNIVATTGYHTQFHDFSKHFGLGIIATPMMAYFKYLHNWSAATCVPSKKTEQDLQKLGFKRLYQVGRGVDVANFHPDKRSKALRDSWGVDCKHTVVMMVSRLSPEKGVDLVIEGFKQLQLSQLHRATKLVIVGDGPDRDRLQNMSQDNEDIIFAGMQTGQDLGEHYASGDVFVFASQVETFGNVVTEAMASGLPVYAFDDAAAGMLVDDDCGGLVATEQTNAFIDMVAQLPKLQRLRQQGKIAQDKVAQMSWQRPAQQMLDMFTDVLGVTGKQR